MSDQFIGKVLAGKYRIDSPMRETDLGRIYHGSHLLMGKRVAVKILNPALAVDENIVERFSAEARSISNISHPNILNVTDFGSDEDGTVFIVFEDAEGETLREIISRGDLFPADRAVRIVKEIATALSAAHVKGLTHKRLSSDNVLLTEDEEVKVLDFGTASQFDNFDDEESARRVRYLSPEQCADSLSADQRSDIYSTGVIFYEMLAGEVPFDAATPGDLMMKHAQEPPPPLSAFRHDLPPQIEPVILQMLAKNPDMRHQSAVELIDDLNRAIRLIGETPAAAATAAGNPNNIWKTAFVVLAGISLLSMALIWATSSKQTDPATFQTDANSLPVQPINPATGMNEQGLSNMVQLQSSFSNSNMTLTMPDTLGGASSNPLWDRGYVPTEGPVYVPPGGNQVTVQNCDPNNPFMPCDVGVTIVTQPVNANVNTAPSPRPTRTPANVQTNAAPSETPKPQTTPAATPPPAKTPEPKPTPAKSPATQTKRSESGKTQDSR